MDTPRGQIKATKIVHASNAFAAHLLPEFQGLITPCKPVSSTENADGLTHSRSVRGQCSQITPTKPYSGSNMLTHSKLLHVITRHVTDLCVSLLFPMEGCS